MSGRAFLLHGAAAAALLLGAACAQRPEAVAPAPVSEAQYYGWTCPRLRGEMGRLDGTLADLYAEQRQSRNDDVLGYIFALAPLATMSGGDLSHQIALSKGEQDAVRSTVARRCHASRF
jgi:secreted PhoX family phosphatase